jgi:hypothetical protein
MWLTLGAQIEGVQLPIVYANERSSATTDQSDLRAIAIIDISR